MKCHRVRRYRGLLFVSILALAAAAHAQMFWGIEEYPIPWPPENETSSSLTTSSVAPDTSPSMNLIPEEDRDVETPFLEMAREAQLSSTSSTGSLGITMGTQVDIRKEQLRKKSHDAK